MKKYKVHISIYVAFFAVWVLMTRGAVSPLIYPDEAGYIGWARELAGRTGETWRYLPGYGLFLSPIFWFTNDILQAYPVIILLNCVCGAAIPVLLYSVLGHFLEGKQGLLAAVTAGFYPAWLLYGNLALSEVFLTFLYTLLLWSVCHWGKSKWSWLVSLLCCVWMVVSHGRSGAVLLGLLVAFCSYAWNKPWRKKALISCDAVLILAVVTGVLYLFGTESVNGVHLREQLMGLFSFSGLWNSFSTLLSQSYYLTLSTFGVAALGVGYGIAILKKKNNPAVWFILVTFLFSMLLSAVFMNHHEKPDHILYGRYNEFVLGGILLLGMTAFFKQRKCGWVFLLFVFLAVFTGLCYGENLIGIDSNLCHTWGLYFYKILFSRFTFLGVTVWFGLWGGMMWLIRRHNPTSALLFLCGLFLVTAFYTKYDYFIKGAAPRYQPSQIADLVEDEVFATPLDGDTMGYPWGVYHLLTLKPELQLSEDAEVLLTQEKSGVILGSEIYDTLYLCQKEGKQKPLSGEAVITDWNENSLTLFVKNTGSPWICYSGAEDLEDCVRVVVWVSSEEKEEQFRVDLPRNLYEGETLEMEIPLTLKDGVSRVQICPCVDLSYTIASACADVTVEQGNMIQCEPAQMEEKQFTLLDAESYPRQTTGMFRGYSTGKTVYDHLGWDTSGKSLILYTKGQAKNVSVSVNDQALPLEKRGGNAYFFSLKGITEIDKITVISDTVVPAKVAGVPEILGFLRADSPCKPVSLFVRGMDKLFGIRWDFCSYGAWIDRITVGEDLQ